MNFDRILTSPGRDAQTYMVRRANNAEVCAFVTAGFDGKTADEVAIANLADLSEQTDGELRLHRLQHGVIGREYSVILAWAECGCTRLD